MGSTAVRRASARSLIDQIRHALTTKDLDAYAAVYAEDGVLEELSSLSPPAHPNVSTGREAIRARLEADVLRDPIGGWEREVESSHILDAIETDDYVAFTEERTYAAGDRVVLQHLARKRDGLITYDRVLLVWDQGT